MLLTNEEMQTVRTIAASFVLPPLKTIIERGDKDDSLAVQTVLAGFIAGKRAANDANG